MPWSCWSHLVLFLLQHKVAHEDIQYVAASGIESMHETFKNSGAGLTFEQSQYILYL
jgi:hypothetical protein